MGADVTADDALLLSLIAAASAEFARETGRVCVPYYAARLFDAPMHRPYALDVDEDLLEVTALTNGDGAAVAANVIQLRPLNAYPKWRIALQPSGGVSFGYADDPGGAIRVQGWWGYAPHYESAWRATGIGVPGGGMTSGTISLNMGATDGFEIGQYLRVDDEIVRVTGRDAAAITLVRGEQGTTAASHSAGAALRIFDVLPDVAHAVTEMAAYAYKALDRVGGRVTVYDGGAALVDDLDPLVRRTLDDHRRKGIRVIR